MMNDLRNSNLMLLNLLITKAHFKDLQITNIRKIISTIRREAPTAALVMLSSQKNTSQRQKNPGYKNCGPRR
jgi:hypothetical protein